MGRGNVCVHGEFEGLYYVDMNNFSYEYQDENGETYIDYDLRTEEWESSLSLLIEDLEEKYKSFARCDEWISRGEMAILENSLFYVTIEDNEWSMAVKLIQKDDNYDVGNLENLQKGLYRKYLEGIKECLFNQFESIGVYCGAWTSGTITRH